MIILIWKSLLPYFIIENVDFALLRVQYNNVLKLYSIFE